MNSQHYAFNRIHNTTLSTINQNTEEYNSLIHICNKDVHKFPVSYPSWSKSLTATFHSTSTIHRVAETAETATFHSTFTITSIAETTETAENFGATGSSLSVVYKPECRWLRNRTKEGWNCYLEDVLKWFCTRVGCGCFCTLGIGSRWQW